MSTSQNIYAIADRAPEFPCWLYGSFTHSWLKCDVWHGLRNIADTKYTHWSPDAPEAPKDAPGDDIRREPTSSLPASPELPESVRQAIQTALDEFFFKEDMPHMRGCVRGIMENITSALTPLWNSAPTPPAASPVAGLPTPETDANALFPASNDDSDKFSPSGTHVDVDFARSLERRLAAARAEVERLTTYNEATTRGINELWKDLEAAGFVPCNDGWGGAAKKALAQLATAKEELTEAKAERDLLFDQKATVVQDLQSLRSELAKANAAVEEWRSAERRLSDAYLRLRKLIPGAFIKPTAPTAEQVWATTEQGLAKMVAQLAAQQSVPPEARAVEAMKEIVYQYSEQLKDCLHPDKIIAAIIQRVCFPQSEGVEWAKKAKLGSAQAHIRNMVSKVRTAATLEGAESVGRAFLELIISETNRVIDKHAPRPTAADTRNT